jgi:hypothetical protein
MATLTRARIASLQQRSFDELTVLPEMQAEEVDVLGNPVSLTTYRSKHGANALLIVVQALRETLFGMTVQICVEGFVVSPLGQKSKATEEMLWDYH